jgi:hypothetical protein
MEQDEDQEGHGTIPCPSGKQRWQGQAHMKTGRLLLQGEWIWGFYRGSHQIHGNPPPSQTQYVQEPRVQRPAERSGPLPVGICRHH